jgi:AP2-like factor (ANT lineage)
MRGSELSALVAEPKLEDFLGGINFSEQHHKANLNVIPSSGNTCYASSGASAGYHQPYHHQNSTLHFADSVMVASSAGVHDGGASMLSAAATVNGGAGAASANGGSIGLSMIKNWLRSQPAPTPQPRVVAAAEGVQAAQGLSLSMNMAGAQGAGMPLLAGGERGRAPESVSTSAQGGAVVAARKEDSGGSGGAGALVTVSTDTGGSGTVAETAARKTVDTFGQRTSIYRGVTR